MEVGLNPDYLTSQVQMQRNYPNSEDVVDSEGSDLDLKKTGGLGQMLWPPEMLLQAQSYGLRRKKRRTQGNEIATDANQEDLNTEQQFDTFKVHDAVSIGEAHDGQPAHLMTWRHAVDNGGYGEPITLTARAYSFAVAEDQADRREASEALGRR